MSSPIYNYGTTTICGKTVGLYLIMLPDEDIFKVIEFQNEFPQGILYQLYQIISGHNGDLLSGTLAQEDVYDKYQQTAQQIDIYLIQVIKHYTRSTKCYIIGKPDNEEELPEVLSDNSYTNKLFKAIPDHITKYDCRYVMASGILSFGSYGQEEVDGASIRDEVVRIIA